MERYRYLPHTADMRFRAYGRNFNEALENSALALLNIMLDIKKIEGSKAENESIAITESGDSEGEIVWFTLQDILSKIDSRQLNAYSFKVTSIKRGKRIKMSGRLMYKKVKENHAMLSVKAVTPHDLTVKKIGSRISVNVVVDV